MTFNNTPQGWLIYSTLGCYLLALIAAALRQKKIADTLYLLGFVIALASWIYRWDHVQHVPMQSLFEVFLTMGMALWPLTWFCRRFLRAGLEPGDILLGIVVLFPAGFIFDAEPKPLPPALQSPLFGPHVAVYMLAYVLMAKAAFQAAAHLTLLKRPKALPQATHYDRCAYAMVLMGFPLLTLGLLLGSWWGALAWGDYWGWDPKELWSLASWLVYLLYFHHRWLRHRQPTAAGSLLVIAGLAAIVITLLWVNLSRTFSGMHNYAS